MKLIAWESDSRASVDNAFDNGNPLTLLALSAPDEYILSYALTEHNNENFSLNPVEK